MISTSCTRFPGAGGSLLGAPAGSPMPRFSSMSLAPSVPINFVLLKKLQVFLFRTLFKTSLSFMFFLELLNGWKKYATLLPIAETPQTLASRRLGRQSAERDADF
ncbi:hypothetical protein QNH26_05475 [Peribacillus frigoritolerans]|uniref:hypothetical protein n=1 Tax=Peribacillus frigoritolerans TaxID=450367 RepID=UPI0024C0EEE0|nr:hypothetical protein [Peribacillus frigoritolerans]WHX68056.1 hypothetical protein QNH26_05475 [Peribacillus frigoritolerans]